VFYKSSPLDVKPATGTVVFHYVEDGNCRRTSVRDGDSSSKWKVPHWKSVNHRAFMRTNAPNCRVWARVAKNIGNDKRASRKLTPLPRCQIYYIEESLRPFSLLDQLLCERLDRRRPMELLCSRIAEVDPARVEALHHLDVQPGPISRRTHRFQNVLPGSLR